MAARKRRANVRRSASQKRTFASAVAKLRAGKTLGKRERAELAREAFARARASGKHGPWKAGEKPKRVRPQAGISRTLPKVGPAGERLKLSHTVVYEFVRDPAAWMPSEAWVLDQRERVLATIARWTRAGRHVRMYVVVSGIFYGERGRGFASTLAHDVYDAASFSRVVRGALAGGRDTFLASVRLAY